MKSEFSEKQYEIFINHELISLGYDIYAPSQRKEKKTGYDTLIQPNKKYKGLILQYKIPSKGAVHSSSFPLNSNIFRFNVYKSNGLYKQHNLLVKHNKSGINAAYCAPLFNTYDDLYENLHNSTILKNSVGIAPYHRLDSDNESHHIEYIKNKALLFSANGNELKINNIIELLESSEIYSGELFKTKLITIFNDNELKVTTNIFNMNSIMYGNNLAVLIKKL